MNTTPLAIFSSFLISAAVLPAATNFTLVQWGEDAGATDIVTSTQSVSTDTTFVSGDVDSPTVGGSYYPSASGRNPDFNVAGSDDTWSINVKQNASGDTINFFSGGGGSPSSIVIWEDFSPMTAVLDYTFSLNASGGESSPELAEYEFVMQDGAGDWYISDTGTNSWGDTNVSNVNASSITWYEYTPYGNTPSGQSQLSAGDDFIGDEPKSPTFAGAQAFGYRQEIPFGALNKDIDVSYFQVIAVVPEPSSTALLGLGGLVMALRRKRG